MNSDLFALKRRLKYAAFTGKSQEKKRIEAKVPVSFLLSQGFEKAGEFTFFRRKVIEEHGFPQSAARLIPGTYTCRELVFFDLETTGLSGGAGNYFFLIGLGFLEGSSLIVEQVFLADYPGEAEYLDYIRERLKRGKVFVSYNGKSFDSHLLRMRFQMNGREYELAEQIDLLYWARRLWKKTLPDCSLKSVEAGVLGINREDDVPGYEIPDIYFSYLRAGDTGPLPRVFEHNLQDILSLVKLYILVEDILSGHQFPPVTDSRALGCWLLKECDATGVNVLKRGFAGGDAGSGRELSLYYKRAGLWLLALPLWRELVENYRSISAVVELAKYYEHREKEPEKAYYWLDKVFAWDLPLSPLLRSELLKRRERLIRKLSS